jgi:hypothetical protein
MALGFLRKAAPEAAPSGKGVVPVDRVSELASRGFSEHEMIDVLRKEGFSADEIDKAMTNVLKLGVTGGPQPPPSAGPEELPSLEQFQTPQPQMPEMPDTSLPQEYYQPQQYSSEEYVDYLVKEKTRAVDEKISEFTVRYTELEKRIIELNNQLTTIIQAKTGEEQQILSRLDSFKDMVNELNIRMGSLEKAFKDTLPALIESVRALCDLVQRLKRES